MRIKNLSYEEKHNLAIGSLSFRKSYSLYLLDNEYINDKLAANKSTCTYVLNKLSKNSDTRIRLKVVKNPNTHLKTLRKMLAKDSFTYIKSFAASRLDLRLKDVINLHIHQELRGTDLSKFFKGKELDVYNTFWDGEANNFSGSFRELQTLIKTVA